MFLTLPFMAAIQIISARIGWRSRPGLAANLGEVLPPALLYGLVALPRAANTINIAADSPRWAKRCGSSSAGLRLSTPWRSAASASTAQIVIPYHRYARYLKLLTLVLFVYVAAASASHAVGRGARVHVHPATFLDRDFVLMVVAVFGTTISPYLFFWQASQESRNAR